MPNIPEILALADFLEALPPENFDIREWGKDLHGQVPTMCGTVACVAGWQCVRMSIAEGLGAKVFHELELKGDRAGLTYVTDYASSKELVELARRHGVRLEPPRRNAMVANRHLPPELAQQSLGLDDEEAAVIFAMDSTSNTFYEMFGDTEGDNPSPRQVARALRAFAKDPDGVLAACREPELEEDL